MPLPESIPPPTPAQLNLRVDIPEVIALSPRAPVVGEQRFLAPELALPYRLSTPLPLPLSALSRINEHGEEGNTHEASEPNCGGDGGDDNGEDFVDAPWTNALSPIRSQKPETVPVSTLPLEIAGFTT